MDYRVLGISSGIGVSLYPFRYKLIGNIESRAIFHSRGDNQWKANFRGIPLWRQLFDATVTQKVNVIISSPDCGSGSVLRYSRNKRLGDIKENKSLEAFFVGVNTYQPDFFYFENLPAMFKSLPLTEFQARTKNYQLIVHEAPVIMWGNSQLYRKRLIIIGIKDSVQKKARKLFKMPDYRHKIQTCLDLYGDLDKIRHFDQLVQVAHIREEAFQPITMYSGFKITVAEITNHWQTVLKDKKRWAVSDRKFQNAPGVYRNRGNDYPATARKANRQFDHNGLMLTPRQLARIQGIPDKFKIYINPDAMGYWINKGRAAVTKTPPMDISKWFFKQLNKFYGT